MLRTPPGPVRFRKRSRSTLKTVTRYYPAERLPQKTLYALEEMLGPRG